jgi:putative cell wall-binding protein
VRAVSPPDFRMSAMSAFTRPRGLGVALASVVVVAGVFGGAAEAAEIPETIAVVASAEQGVVAEPSHIIDYLAVTWSADDSTIESHEIEAVSAEPHGAVRFRHGDSWGQWIAFTEDGAQAPGEWGSGLVDADRAEAYEIRGIPEWALDPKVFVINTKDGPPMTGTAQLQGAVGESSCLSRAEWGADESLRMEEDGSESWSPAFYPVQGVIVHHAGSNDGADPAEMVRAIYAFHTLGRGWGDIAYNYLVDDAGRIYEGRWSGVARMPCSGGGDGTDFAHNEAGDLVRGGHTKYHHAGNVGVAMLGNYASPAENHDPDWVQAHPTSAMVDGLETLLAELTARHGLDPTGKYGYVNPRCGALEDSPYWDCDDTELYVPGVIRNVISGHRDWRPTACPGAVTYALLPDVRGAVSDLVGPAPITGTVTDVWGYPIPGASIHSDTGVSAGVASDGSYDLGDLASGSRRIEAAASGFVTAGKHLILIHPGATVDLKLASLIDRHWGANRYATSAAVSKVSFAPGVPVVYVAVGTGFADALSVAPVGGVEGAPVLLTRADVLPGVVARELDRLDPERIVVVGGPVVVSDAVMRSLGKYAVSGSVTRLWGADRYGTSVAISEASFSPGVPVVYVAVGTGFADALSVAPVGGVSGGPVLLTRSGSLPGVVAGELGRLDPDRIVVVGGPAVVSEAVVAELGKYAPLVDRLWGADRFGTSVAISEASFAPGVPVVYVAVGTGFADALSVAPVGGVEGAPVLLTRSGSLPGVVARELGRLDPDRIVVVGGPAVVSNVVIQHLGPYLP